VSGRKDDTSKVRYSEIPPDSLQLLAAVMTYGAAKYGSRNYLGVEDWAARYYSAGMRHREADRAGEWLDPETGFPHLAHAMACDLILLERRLQSHSRVFVTPPKLEAGSP
jgi:hypothetical protein